MMTQFSGNGRVFATAAACAAFAMSGVTHGQDSVQPGDVALGLSVASPDDTLSLIRPDAGGLTGTEVTDGWNAFAFVQDVKFTSTNGILNNAQGMLLGMNFGTSAGGGSLYLYDNQPTGGGVALIEAGTGNDTQAVLGNLTRLVGLSVSPDNSKIAVVGYDTGEVYVLDFDEAGESVSLVGVTIASGLQQFETQGTVWIDNNTVLACSAEGQIISVDATTLAVTPLLDLGEFTDAFTSLEFNADLSEFLIVSTGIFDGGTINTLYVVDLASNSVVETIDLSTSANTLRGLAYTPGGDLMMSQFAGGGGVIIDMIENFAANAGSGTIADNSSTDFFTTTTSSSFNGLDVAFGTGGDVFPAKLTGFTKIFGGTESGGLPELLESDDERYTVNSQFGFSAQEANLTEVEFDFFTTRQSPTIFNLLYEGLLSDPGGIGSVKILNVSAQTFDNVANFAPGNTESVFEFNGIALKNRIETGAIVVRIRQTVVATFAASGFQARFDQIAGTTN